MSTTGAENQDARLRLAQAAPVPMKSGCDKFGPDFFSLSADQAGRGGFFCCSFVRQTTELKEKYNILIYIILITKAIMRSYIKDCSEKSYGKTVH
jgi:hypothetical protein